MIEIYLLGCVAASLTLSIKIFVSWFLRWLTKANILSKNLQKIELIPQNSLFENVAYNIISILVEIFLSWIGFFLNFGHLILILLQHFREFITPVPEAIKELRFPLWNNRLLSRESVWAYTTALQIKNGLTADRLELRKSLAGLSNTYPEFDATLALAKINDLKVIEPELIESETDYWKRKHDNLFDND